MSLQEIPKQRPKLAKVQILRGLELDFTEKALALRAQSSVICRS